MGACNQWIEVGRRASGSGRWGQGAARGCMRALMVACPRMADVEWGLSCVGLYAGVRREAYRRGDMAFRR